ncbi:hypothetical protein BCV70DRAFT_33163 [Testicularia cyperi]|uniref:Uncharacterized protein n=1 Tax=Testicularia cyperi TaxID=1882483 RepID=A0A317XJM9_9BASI|nr:hypothetical protein BCV70DRAFT_33163 [Testicularia cyperi]
MSQMRKLRCQRKSLIIEFRVMGYCAVLYCIPALACTAGHRSDRDYATCLAPPWNAQGPDRRMIIGSWYCSH